MSPVLTRVYVAVNALQLGGGGTRHRDGQPPVRRPHCPGREAGCSRHRHGADPMVGETNVGGWPT